MSLNLIAGLLFIIVTVCGVIARLVVRKKLNEHYGFLGVIARKDGNVIARF